MSTTTSSKRNKQSKSDQPLQEQTVQAIPIPPPLPVKYIDLNEQDPANILTALELEKTVLGKLKMMHSSELARLKSESLMLYELLKNTDPQLAEQFAPAFMHHRRPVSSGDVYYAIHGASSASLEENDMNELSNRLTQVSPAFIEANKISSQSNSTSNTSSRSKLVSSIDPTLGSVGGGGGAHDIDNLFVVSSQLPQSNSNNNTNNNIVPNGAPTTSTTSHLMYGSYRKTR